VLRSEVMQLREVKREYEERRWENDGKDRTTATRDVSFRREIGKESCRQPSAFETGLQESIPL
jgi:hypothetical protein